MAFDAATLQFFQYLNVSENPERREVHDCWLEDMLKSEIPRLLLESQRPSPTTDTCILEQLGGFITYALSILSQLAKSVVHGERISTYARKKLDELVVEHDLSDLDVVDYLDDKHGDLKSIVLHLVEVTKICSDIWANSSKAPLPDQAFFLSENVAHRTLDLPSAASNNTSLEDRPSEPGLSRPSAQHYRSLQGDAAPNLQELATPTGAYHPEAYAGSSQPADTMPDSNQGTANASARTYRSDRGPGSPLANERQRSAYTQTPVPSIETPVEDRRRSQEPSKDRESPPSLDLKSRGSGHHTCPQGLSCTKGGVDARGVLVVFERNSAFRAHLEKHEKTYKCDLPGCTNTKGFARIDQLVRHKETVRHGRRVSGSGSAV